MRLVPTRLDLTTIFSGNLFRKKRVVRRKTQRKVIKQPQKKVIPKLQMIIHGISGEEGSRSAIVTFDREQLLLFEGDQDRNKKFKVIRIDEKRR